MKYLIVLLLLLTISAPVMGQATNDAFGTLTVNGEEGTATVLLGGDIELEVISTNPDIPFLLFSAPALSIGEVVIPPIMVDVGPAASITIIANGLDVPANFLDLFANTGPAGHRTFTFSTDAGLPLGTLAAVQALLLDPLSPTIAVDTAATEIVLGQFDYGTVTYARGSGTSNVDSFSDGFTGGSVNHMTPSADVDMQSLGLVPRQPRDWTFSTSTTSGRFPERYVDPDPAHPRPFNDNSSFVGINTVHGKVYHFEDNASVNNEFGFFVVNPGVGPIEIPGTRFSNGTSTISPWETEVAINEDSTVMAAVLDVTSPSSQPDQIYLIKLDGTVFASTGTPVANITPATAPAVINESSIFMTNGAVYFTDTSTTQGILYRAPQDGSLAATSVTLPPLGTGQPAPLVDDEMFIDPVSGDLYLQAGLTTSQEDLYRLTNITPGGETALNITSFPTATEFEEFGDDYSGSGVTFSLSPSGTMCAFVLRIAADDELFYVSTSGGVATQVTDNATFDIALDDVHELVMHSDTDIIFQCGAGTTDNDVYNFDITTSTLTNITLTNGHDPSVSGLPVPNVAGTIDSDGQINLADRIVIARDNSGVATSGWNLIGIEFATLTVYDITGNEFSGGTAPNLDESSISDIDFTFAPIGTIAYFKGSTATHSGTTNEALFSVDLSGNNAATLLTPDLASDGIDDIRPLGTGAMTAFTYTASSSSDQELTIANFGVVGFTQFPSGIGSGSLEISDGSITPLAVGADPGFVFAQGTNSATNPTDAVLIAINTATGGAIVLDSNAAFYHVYGTAHP